MLTNLSINVYSGPRIDEIVMTEQLINTIADEARRRHGWSQSELATRAGLPPETVSRAKRGCRADTLERLAKAAGLRLTVVPDDSYVEQLLGGRLLSLS